jgi:hypothetical protein
VTQATPHLNQLAHWLQDTSSSVLASQQFLRWRNFLQASQGWWLSSAVLLVLLVLSWQLVLSLGLGLAVLIWVYLAQQGWWQMPQRIDWRKLWSRANRSLTIASISGIVVAGGSFVSIGIWRETHRSWLATGVIIEGLLIVAVLGLLIWQAIGRLSDRPVPLAEKSLIPQLFADLSDADPLKRLVAIRQLTHQFQMRLDRSTSAIALPMAAANLADCFRLMLNRETEPLVCSALLEGLAVLAGSRQLAASPTEAISPELQRRSQVKAEQLQD